MMSWSLHAVVQLVEQDKGALWEKGDTRHDRICLKPASVESCVFPRECLPTAWLNSLPAFCATFSCFEVTIKESCEHKPFFSLLPYVHGFCSVLLHIKNSPDINICQPANEPITILKLSQMHEVRGYLPQMCSDITCIVCVKGKLTVFLLRQTRSPPIRGTTVISAHQVKAPQWPHLIQTTGKVEAQSEIYPIAHDYWRERRDAWSYKSHT